MADLNMGCSKNALALNYLPAEGIDVETCCDFGPPQDAVSYTHLTLPTIE